MSTVRTAFIALIPLVSCGSVPEKTDKISDASVETPKVMVDYDSGTKVDHSKQCDPAHDRHQSFKVDGGTITFDVPTLCDPTPYIEKGDPQP